MSFSLVLTDECLICRGKMRPSQLGRIFPFRAFLSRAAGAARKASSALFAPSAALPVFRQTPAVIRLNCTDPTCKSE